MRKMLRRTLRENIEIEIQPNSETVLAFADRAQLESSVLNLALNAQDAMARRRAFDFEHRRRDAG